ncbi:hypothetical protein Tco_0010480 [Tanacetum coccineum]
MRDQTADEYFSKIEPILTLLTDLGLDMSHEDVVTYAINDLSDKYGSLAQIIAHKDPFPDLATVRSMVATEELRLRSRSSVLPTGTTSTPPGFQSGQQPAQQTFSPQQQALLLGIVQGSTPANGQATLLPQAFNTMTLQDPTDANWNMDTGASSHLNSNATNLSTLFNSCMYPSVLVGDGKSIPVTNTGHSTLPTPYRLLHLNNVLITPNIVKNLISVRQFVRDNKCTIEFDEFGFSVKDYWTRQILLRCDSTGDLYPVTSLSYPQAFLVGQQT